MSASLRDALKTRGIPLSQQVLDRMYQNPWWIERYGQRGRKFADEDSAHHVTYLLEALSTDDAAVFEKYAVWLRSVLVSRGMCSEHLAENFSLLSEAIAGAGLPDANLAAAILDRGSAALRYQDGEAGRLDGDRARLIDAVRTVASVTMREDDQRYLVSYFIDAAATGNRASLEQFAARFAPDLLAALTRQARSSERR